MKQYFYALAVLVVGLTASLSLSVANAEFGSTPAGGNPENQVSLANNKDHRVRFFDTTTRTGNAMQWALNNQFPRFGFSWTYVTTDSYDVRVHDSNYSDNGVYGWVNCPAGATETGSNPNRRCYGQQLHINEYPPYAAGYDTQFGVRALSCHELGHTVGLRHTSNANSCLNSNAAPNNINSNTYSGADVNDVLAAY